MGYNDITAATGKKAPHDAQSRTGCNFVLPQPMEDFYIKLLLLLYITESFCNLLRDLLLLFPLL
jgi:hypothetical protein